MANSPASTDWSLSAIASALPDLALRLECAGMRRGPDRWQNVLDLLLAYSAQKRLPQNSADLRAVLVPLLCSSVEEIVQFDRLFPAWLADSGFSDTSSAEPAAPASAHPTAEIPRRSLGIVWLVGTVVVWCLLTFALYWHHSRNVPATKPVAPVATAASAPPTTQPAENNAWRLEPVLPRRRAQTPNLEPENAAWLSVLDRTIHWLPAVLALGWLLLRWRNWRTVLKRRRGNPDDPLHSIRLDAELDRLADAPALRAAYKRLHAPVATPTRRLDADRSVEQTARAAGLFRPVCRVRQQVPELLVAVEYRHGRDQMAGMAEQVVERLQRAGLSVLRYRYRDTPRRLLGDNGRWHRLDALAARHPGARLLLIGEPAALIDPLAGTPQPWTRELALWPRRSLLTPRRVSADWLRALTRQGLVVADLDSAGIQRAVLHLGGEVAADLARLPGATVLLPALLLDGRRWQQVTAPSPADKAELLATLATYLGADGQLLLAAMAVYPQLDWRLTRGLDLSLFPDSPDATREPRLLKIARLPWSRAGWLPDWLRRSLLSQLASRDWRRLRALYRTLFAEATTSGTGDIHLPVSVPTGQDAVTNWRSPARRLRQWLADLRALAAEDDVLRDAILADVLLGWRSRLLDFDLPRRVLRPLLQGALGRALARATVLALLVAVLAGWGAHGLWQASGRVYVQGWLLERQRAALAAYRIDLHYRPELLPLAEAVRESLLADGFAVGSLSATEATDATASAEPVNRVQWGDDQDTGTAERIAARVAELAWGCAAEITNSASEFAATAALQQPPAARQLRVLLASPGRSGCTFRDALAQPLSADERARLQRGEIPAEPEAPPPLPQPFRDPLKSGGFGPEMVLLPAGTFMMGSPEQEPDRTNAEGPQHAVTVPAFALGRTEVSFADYDRFAEATGRTKPKDEWGRGAQPVINVSWNDAQAYADWLSEQTGRQYRLPSEAEWEYAARAGTTTPFWTGNCIKTDQANYAGTYDYNHCGAKTGVDRQQTVAVGSLPANAFGLHETAGNVWEWTADCWHDNYGGAPGDGSAWRETNGGDCARRVLRGGSWDYYPQDLRSAYRYRVTAGGAIVDVGIRLARTP